MHPPSSGQSPPPTGLPVEGVLGQLFEALAERGSAVLLAPPGAGKSTLVPLEWLQRMPPGEEGHLLMIQPRRAAARLLAKRLASMLGEVPGRQIGYRLRFDTRVSAATRLEIMTPGVLLRRLQRDPFLEGCAGVIIDELHERSLDLDLVLGAAVQLRREWRDDLQLLAMSATLDPAPVQSLLGDCPLIECAGRAYPVEITHREGAALHPSSGPRAIAAVCASELRSLSQELPDKHILAFLPGAASIRATQELLSPLERPVLPLFSRLPLPEQSRALSPAGPPRVVLSTNLAETSVTLPGVGAVLDCGLERRPYWDAPSSSSGLEQMRISMASARQRAGRAGRTEAGRCWRLWSARMEESMEAYAPPAVRHADLGPALLALLSWGVDPAEFPWLEPPAAASLRLALEELDALGLCAQGQLTPLGQRVAQLPVHPRLGVAMEWGQSLGCRGRAIRAAALLSEGAGAGGRSLEEQLQGLRRGRRRPGAERVQQVVEQLEGIARRLWGPEPPEGSPGGLVEALRRAFPGRVALRRSPGARSFKLASGSGAQLPRGAPDPNGDCFLALGLQAARGPGREPLLRELLPLSIETLPWRDETELSFDPSLERVVARRRQRYLGLILREHPVPLPGDDPRIPELLHRAALLDWTSAFSPSPSCRQLIHRLEFLARHTDAPEEVSFRLEPLLRSACQGKSSLAELRSLRLEPLLRQQLGWEMLRRLEEQAPAEVTLPSGSAGRLDYAQDPPVLRARIQQLYGLRETPSLAGGRCRCLVELLDPGGKVAHRSSDLSRFWEEGWRELRKAMRGRYPKHHWPEQPRLEDASDRVGRAGRPR